MKLMALIKKRWYLFAGFIILLILVLYQRDFSQIKSSKEKTTYKVKRQTIKEELSLSGEIEAEEHVTLRFQSSGRLSWVGVKEGDYVKKYQGVASLDQREVQQNLKKYLNTFVNERLDYDQELQDAQIKYTGGLSEDARREALRVLEKAQYDLNNAIIDVELKNLAIEYSYLASPIEGIVIRVGSPYAGVNITPAQAEIEIVNPNTIYFSVAADQTEVVKLKEGKKGNIVFDAYPDDQIKSEVDKISFIPKEGETGTVYEVKMYFDYDNSDYKYRVGMTGDVDFLLRQRKNILAIPALFIKSDKGKKYVYKFENNKKIKTYITLGDEIDEVVVVDSGLKENDEIVK